MTYSLFFIFTNVSNLYLSESPHLIENCIHIFHNLIKSKSYNDYGVDIYHSATSLGIGNFILLNNTNAWSTTFPGSPLFKSLWCEEGRPWVKGWCMVPNQYSHSFHPQWLVYWSGFLEPHEELLGPGNIQATYKKLINKSKLPWYVDIKTPLLIIIYKV